MTDSLHETITEILSAHQANSWGCLCGWQYNMLDDYSHFDHAATVLIRELNLIDGDALNQYLGDIKTAFDIGTARWKQGD